MQILKLSTAWTAIVGPILDSAGAEYTGAVIGDLSISKNGTEAAMASAATLTHVSNGFYTLVGTTGNSDTLGALTIRCNKATYQMPPKEYTVLAAAAFDTLVTNGTLASTTSGRTIDVSAGGEVGLDWANVGSPTTTQALTGTTIATTQKVDVETIKTNPVVNAGTVTFPTTATLASTTNITAGTIATVSGNVTGNVGGNVTGSVGSVATGGITTASFAAGAINAAAIAADAITDAKVASDVTIASVTGNVGGIAGTTTTLDALQTALNSAHGAGSWATATGFSTLTQAQVTGGAYALDSASFSFNAALDFTTTQKAATLARVTLADTLTTYTGNTLQTGDSFARIGLAGAGLTAIPWPAAWDAEVQSEVTDALNAALTESYRSAGATGSVAQMLYEIIAHLGESAIASTTKTLKKLDGSTTAKTYTLNSATTPTAITETT